MADNYHLTLWSSNKWAFCTLLPISHNDCFLFAGFSKASKKQRDSSKTHVALCYMERSCLRAKFAQLKLRQTKLIPSSKQYTIFFILGRHCNTSNIYLLPFLRKKKAKQKLFLDNSTFMHHRNGLHLYVTLPQ